MHTASTASGPRARAASAQATAESMPPERPSTARARPALPTSSRRKLTRIHSTSGATMRSGLEDETVTGDALEVAERHVEALVAPHGQRRAAPAQRRGVERQRAQLGLQVQGREGLAGRVVHAAVPRERGAVLDAA